MWQQKIKLLTLRKSAGFVIGLVIIIVVLVFDHDIRHGMTAVTNIVSGWSWNSYDDGTGSLQGLGWMSNNCVNDFDNDGVKDYQCIDGTGTSLNYGVTVDAQYVGELTAGDNVQGCAWSSDYGWICFNGGSGVSYPAIQCDSDVEPACTTLDADGVWVAGHLSGVSPELSNLYYTLDSPVYSELNGWDPLEVDGSENAAILSLWDVTDPARSQIGFPYTMAESIPPVPYEDLMMGCVGCDASSGTCAACLNVSVNESSDTNPNPNLLCRGMSLCNNIYTVPYDGGSCNTQRDLFKCWVDGTKDGIDGGNPGFSECTSYPGVLVNYNQSIQEYELCGWGWHGYDGSVGAPPIGGSKPVLIDTFTNGRKTTVLGLTSDNKPVMFYPDDNFPGDIYIAKCSNADCSGTIDTNNIVTVQDSLGTRGFIGALRTNNFPAFAYMEDYSASSETIYFVNCTSLDCVGDTAISLRDPGRGSDTAWSQYSWDDMDMVIPADDRPLILFARCENDCNLNVDIVLIRCSLPDCSNVGANAFTTIAQDNSDDKPMRDPAIALDQYGLPVITYWNPIGPPDPAAPGKQHVIRCGNLDCTIIDSDKTFVHSGSSEIGGIKVGADDLPVIAFEMGVTPRNLWITKCTSIDCSTTLTTSVASGIGDDQSEAVSVQSLALTSTNPPIPIVAYVNVHTEKLYILTCSQADCSDIGANIIQQPDIDAVGRAALVLDASDEAVIFYRSTLSPSEYKIVRCVSTDCDFVLVNDVDGFGWIAFSPDETQDVAYVGITDETGNKTSPSGSIFSEGSITSPAAPTGSVYNAAYLIQAGGSIQNWTSAQLLGTGGSESFLRPGALLPDRPKFLSKGTNRPDVYSNVLGKIDLKGLLTTVGDGKYPPITSGTNKYGRTVNHSTLSSTFFNQDMLDNVYYIVPGGTLTLTASSFNIGSSASISGAGIIVVDGDLFIDQNISYGAGGIAGIKQLASVVWVVKGDVTIDTDVTEVAGTFILLGDGDVCNAVTGLANGCGRFTSGSSNDQLKISGTVIAHQFKFDRAFAASSGPAENFISDGRLQANPPTGLTEFSKSVPRFSSAF